METTVDLLRRQGRLLASLLTRAMEALGEGDLADADGALCTFGDHLQRRIELAEDSVFPWIERRVGDPQFFPVARLHLQHACLADRTTVALAALGAGRGEEALEAVKWLHILLEAHLDEEDQVLWPVISSDLRA